MLTCFPSATHPYRDWETLGLRRAGFSPALSLLMSAFALLIPPAGFTTHLQRLTERSPTICLRISAASVTGLAPLHLPRRTTRSVSYYALFKCMAASKPTSWLSVNLHLFSHLDIIWDPYRDWVVSLLSPDVSTRCSVSQAVLIGIRSLPWFGKSP